MISSPPPGSKGPETAILGLRVIINIIIASLCVQTCPLSLTSCFLRRKKSMLVLRSLFFVILALSVVMGLVPWLILRWSGGVPPLTPSIWLLGLLPLLAGLTLFLWCNELFTFKGRGSLAPIGAPIFLVRSGPYRRVRNPMYLAVFLILGGEALLFHSPWLLAYLVLVMIVVQLFVVFVEEPMLRRKFGESYQNYLRTVPRWLPRTY
jgi:protein-S-isoprenylcysteine O-methyltransferase Ste14